MRREQLFVSVYGQQDNLGDSVLRRGMLESLRSGDIELHIYNGDNSADFTSALGLNNEDILYSSRRAWWAAYARSVAKRRASYVFNPGEAGSGTEYVSRGTAAALLATRLGGGQVLHLGVGLRSTDAQQRDRVAPALRSCTMVSWRDPRSRDAVGIGSVQPDWAFANGLAHGQSDSSGRRGVLAVTMRGDRESPSAAWYEIVRRVADLHSLSITVVNQVRRDETRSREIAYELGAALMTWPPETNHRDWEGSVRALYAASAAVLSDRLHALIMGATEGAVPFGLTVGTAEKVARTLEPLGWDRFCFSASDLPSDRAIAAISEGLHEDRSLLSTVPEAGRRLREISEEVTRRLRRRRNPGGSTR